MKVSSNAVNLTPPRYVPLVVKGTLLAVWYDSQEDQYLALCPACHELITCDTPDHVYYELVWSRHKCCQGCRARLSFQQDPGLIGIFLDYWYRKGNFPESTSWLEAIPPEQFNLWAREIRAALEADQKKKERFLATGKNGSQNASSPLFP